MTELTNRESKLAEVVGLAGGELLRGKKPAILEEAREVKGEQAERTGLTVLVLVRA